MNEKVTYLKDGYVQSATIKSDDAEATFNDETSLTDLRQLILDFSLSLDIRIRALDTVFCRIGDDAIEILSSISGMYQFSGGVLMEQTLVAICERSTLSPFLKLESAKALHLFHDMHDVATERKQMRLDTAFRVLDTSCAQVSKATVHTPTPCRVDCILLLMTCDIYRDNSLRYFRDVIADKKIECDFRYKTMLRLESAPDIQNRHFFLKHSALCILDDVENPTMYRILAAQYLLQKVFSAVASSSAAESVLHVESVILAFAEDDQLDYNLRADAADTLLSLGCVENKRRARDVIDFLAMVGGQVRSVFDNAQNVHVEEIESSVSDALGFLLSVPVEKPASEDAPVVDLIFVHAAVRDLIRKLRCDHSRHDDDAANVSCFYSDSKWAVDIVSAPPSHISFCCTDCEKAYAREHKMLVSLNRILIDRVLYSKFAQTLGNILVKLWLYISSHESKDTMTSRLLEELEDMSGTCSSGFASRLVNVISGFGDFNLRISWADQIVANFIGRINALARSITEPYSIYFKPPKDREIVELHLRSIGVIRTADLTAPSVDVDLKATRGGKTKKAGGGGGGGRSKKKDVAASAAPVPSSLVVKTAKEIVDEHLSSDRDEKVRTAVDSFSESVLAEMTIDINRYADKPNFMKFFRDHMLAIREQLYEEFKEFVTDTEFDLASRRAVSVYEGLQHFV